MIYYIYKVRRKQISIRFFRFTLPHRYLRYISWISWEGGHRPPPAGSSIPCSTLCRSPRTHRFRGGAYPPKPQQLRPYLCLHPEDRQTPSDLSPEKKKKHLSSLFPRTSRVSLLLYCSARGSSRILPAAHLRPVHRPLSTSPSAALPQTKKMRAHGIAPRTRKSVDFSLKKTHVGTPGLHALASAARTYSLTARIALFPFSFFTKEKKKENRSKFSRFEYIARTHFVRPHDVRDWPRASSAETKVAKSTDFCFIFESLPISLQDLARNSIGKCCWHIKDHYPGVNKASRIFPLLLHFFFSQNLSPQKFDSSQKI